MSKILDSFYTPSELARELINSVQTQQVDSIVDFCVGEGRLLQAASTRWKRALLYGTDICPSIIAKMKVKNPDWVLGNCDFLNKNSRKSSRVLKRKFDLVLSNPPFTCIGSSSHRVLLDGFEFNVSLAMAFIVEAISYIAENGKLYGILPESVGYSEKDKPIREYLEREYNFTILSEKKGQDFENCSPNIILVSLNDWDININKEPLIYSGDVKVKEIIRGTIGMHQLDNMVVKKGLNLVHTTNLLENSITNFKYKVAMRYSYIEGSGVLIPRVGNPNPSKVCVMNTTDIYALSDCVIALKTNSFEEAKLLKKYILDNWDNFKNLYKGTGAKFTTLSRLNSYFNI